MNRAGLLTTLAIGLIIGMIFGIDAQLDLKIAAKFYEVVYNGNTFGMRIYPPLMRTHNIGLWFVIALVTCAVVCLIWNIVRPQGRVFISTRALLFLLSTFLLGPGLLVNVLLKDHWGRPRPIDVTEFGGNQHFVAWWDPRGDCPSNCSFVSGDVATAFWTIAPAALVPSPWQAVAYVGAIGFGIAMGAFRIMAGGHFFSDVAFAGIFTISVIWFSYALIFRWTKSWFTEPRT